MPEIRQSSDKGREGSQGPSEQKQHYDFEGRRMSGSKSPEKVIVAGGNEMGNGRDGRSQTPENLESQTAKLSDREIREWRDDLKRQAQENLRSGKYDYNNKEMIGMQDRIYELSSIVKQRDRNAAKANKSDARERRARRERDSMGGES